MGICSYAQVTSQVFVFTSHCLLGCRCYKNKYVLMDHNMNTQLVDAAEPAISTYMEYDEIEKDFKIISGSHIDSASFGKESLI